MLSNAIAVTWKPGAFTPVYHRAKHAYASLGHLCALTIRSKPKISHSMGLSYFPFVTTWKLLWPLALWMRGECLGARRRRAVIPLRGFVIQYVDNKLQQITAPNKTNSPAKVPVCRRHTGQIHHPKWMITKQSKNLKPPLRKSYRPRMEKLHCGRTRV